MSSALSGVPPGLATGPGLSARAIIISLHSGVSCRRAVARGWCSSTMSWPELLLVRRWRTRPWIPGLSVRRPHNQRWSRKAMSRSDAGNGPAWCSGGRFEQAALLFDGEVRVEVDPACGIEPHMPSQSAMTATSTRARNSFIAQVCRRTWGVGCLVRRDGQLRAAVTVCFATRPPTASRLSGVPRADGEQRVAGVAATFAHPGFEDGDGLFGQRCRASFLPLPVHATCGPVPSTTSWLHSPVSSETRRPVSAATSRRAWSRRPVQVCRSGAATRASSSGRVRYETSGAGPALVRGWPAPGR